MFRYLPAVALLCLMASAAEARPRFQEGARVQCEPRYPWTCDERGWVGKSPPVRARRHKRQRKVVATIPAPRPRPAAITDAGDAPRQVGNMLRAYADSLIRPAARCFEFERVDPRVRQVVADTARHFGGVAIVTSCFRSVAYNRKVGGVGRSQHIARKAIDFKIAGVSPSALARYARRHPVMRAIGGVGRYAGRDFIHVDSGPRRDWYWQTRPAAWRYARRHHRLARS